jgi:hypothetical protein
MASNMERTTTFIVISGNDVSAGIIVFLQLGPVLS